MIENEFYKTSPVDLFQLVITEVGVEDKSEVWYISSVIELAPQRFICGKNVKRNLTVEH